MNRSLFGKVYIQFSVQQNYGISFFFPMVPSPSPQKKETQKQVPQTFEPPKNSQGEKPKEVSNPNTLGTSFLWCLQQSIRDFEPQTPWEPASNHGASCPSKKGQLKELPWRSLRKLRLVCNKW